MTPLGAILSGEFSWTARASLLRVGNVTIRGRSAFVTLVVRLQWAAMSPADGPASDQGPSAGRDTSQACANGHEDCAHEDCTDEVARLTELLAQSTASLRLLEQIVERAPFGIVAYDRFGRARFANERVLDAVGAIDVASFDTESKDFIRPEEWEKYSAAVGQGGSAEATAFRLQVETRSGESAYVGAVVTPIVEDGELQGAVGVFRNVSDQVQQNEELRWFKAIADLTTDIVGISAVDGQVNYLNPAGRRFFGVDDKGPWKLSRFFERVAPEFHHALLDDAFAALRRGEVWQGDVALISGCDGQRHPMSAVVIGVHDENGALIAAAVTYRDLTDRLKLESELAHAASHDSLTGLAGRQALFSVLEASLEMGEAIAVLYFDLDDFKVVNDSLGHSVGDDVLTQLAHRIRGAARETDVVGRLGGDEFLVICRGVSDPEEATEIANRILASVRQPMQIGARHHLVTGSIGIAMATSPGTSAVSLIQEADIAMYRAKRAGRRQSMLFDDSMRVEAVDRLELEREVRVALERNEFELYFQPLRYFDRTVVQNFEALIRWNHPRYGLLMPVDFLPTVDEVGLTSAVGDWVYRTAATAVGAMRMIEPETTVGVNVDSDQLRQPGFVEGLMHAISEAGVPGSALTIEITEHVMMHDVEQTRHVLEQLRAIGVSVAIDDFGTGYSNLDLLRRLPVDYLKIDQSFIAGLGIEPGDSQLVRMILGLSSELGIEVIAEGIEAQLQEDELRQLGCRIGQGYLYSQPLGFDDAIGLLRTQRQLPSLR